MFLSVEIRQTKFGTTVNGLITSQITRGDYRTMLLGCGDRHINKNRLSACGSLLKGQIM